MDEARLLDYITKAHRGAIEAARVKHVCHKSKKKLFERIAKDIEADRFDELDRSLQTLFSIVDGVEQPLFVSLNKHSGLYLKFIDTLNSAAHDEILKINILKLGSIIEKVQPKIKEVSRLIGLQSSILYGLKTDPTKPFLEEIRLLSDVQESINSIYSSLEVCALDELYPLYRELIPATPWYRKAYDALIVKNKEVFKNAYNSIDDNLKCTVALFISELVSNMGGPFAAYLVYSTTGNRFIAATVAGTLGDYVFGVASFLPAYYILNIRRLWNSNDSTVHEHLNFIGHCFGLLLGNILASAIIYTPAVIAAAVEMNKTNVHPSIAVGANMYSVSAAFIFISNFVNMRGLAIWKARKIEINKEIEDAIRLLEDKKLSIRGNWWWYNKKQYYHDYKVALLTVNGRLRLIRQRLQYDQNLLMGKGDIGHLYAVMLDKLDVITDKNNQAQNHIKILKKDFLELPQQQNASELLNSCRYHLVKLLTEFGREVEQVPLPEYSSRLTRFLKWIKR